MEKQCIHCGLNFRLYNKGFLYIHTENNHPLFERENKEWLRTNYHSVENLENLLHEANKFFSENEVLCGISLSSEIPHLTLSLASLYARVQERETVELIHHGKFISYLQPIINLKEADKIYGYESLLRAEAPIQISPGKLFSTAHETGMLSLLDKRAREAAIKAKKERIPEGIKNFINFLPSTIYNPAYCLQHTFELVDRYGINPDDLVFEVVESEKIKDIDHLKKVLNTYKRQGMKVALDDVGAGFSTLEVLEMLNPDYVKIDRQYINHCDSNAANQEFLGKVIELAKKLDITILAEGIERYEELEYCRKAGIDLAQGFYIGKPSLSTDFMPVTVL